MHRALAPVAAAAAYVARRPLAWKLRAGLAAAGWAYYMLGGRRWHAEFRLEVKR